MTGGFGSVERVTEFEGDDDAPVPTAFVAVTVKVYDTPLVSPVTVMGDAVLLLANPPGFEVTVYEVMGEPPSGAEVSKAMTA